MFEIAWSKLMLIGVIALIVIGPKDLPEVLRSAGQMLGKLRRMADEFRGQFNDAIRESEFHEFRKGLDEVSDSVRSATSGGFDPIDTIRNEVKSVIEERKALGATDPAGKDPSVYDPGEPPPPQLASLPAPDAPQPITSGDIDWPEPEAAPAPAENAPKPKKKRARKGGADAA